MAACGTAVGFSIPVVGVALLATHLLSGAVGHELGRSGRGHRREPRYVLQRFYNPHTGEYWTAYCPE